MNVSKLLNKALDLQDLSIEEGVFLFENASTTELMGVANTIRKRKIPNNKVTWIIDRNLNTTNVCVANCKFCNFYRIPGHPESYITSMEEYEKKIEETIRYGGEQLLLQGGHHPELGLDFYVNIFKGIKERFPNIKNNRVLGAWHDHRSTIMDHCSWMTVHARVGGRETG